MQINWSFDKTLTAYYYIKQAKQIQRGFFQRIRAFILPTLHQDAWYFPDYGLFKDEEWVRRLTNQNLDSNNRELIVTDEYLVNKVIEKLDLFAQESDIADIKAQFETTFPKVLDYTSNLFPHQDRIRSLTILPTKFGTGGSYFAHPNPDGTCDLYNTVRIDKNYTIPINGFISNSVMIELQYDDKKFDRWTAHKNVSDFLLHNTKLKELVPDLSKNKVVDFLEDYKGDLAIQSAHYLRDLGYPLPNSFSYQNQTILFDKEPLKNLENKEIEILKLLIDNRSHIVTFEQVGDTYWGEEVLDKFSLAALAKFAEKLRDSFESNNIPTRCLQTVRKKGYLLYD